MEIMLTDEATDSICTVSIQIDTMIHDPIVLVSHSINGLCIVDSVSVVLTGGASRHVLP